MTCPYAHDDAAYVLGALSAAERLEFEQHLAGCDSCTRAVADVAGLPGLLGRIDAGDLTRPVDPVPETLLPALLAEVRRNQRRRTFVTAGLAAAAAVVVLVSLGLAGAFGSLGSPGGSSATSTTGPPTTGPPIGGTPMVATGAAPVRATVALQRVPWGTRLDMTCTYETDVSSYGDLHAASYELVVRTRSGLTQRVASWRSLPGQSMEVTATTAVDRSRIASVEVRTSSGVPVLRLRT